MMLMPVGPGSTGAADFRLGIIQSVLENLFPGIIIRPFRNGTGCQEISKYRLFT